MNSIAEPGRTARLNMRISPSALELLREAAELQQQDLSAFVLGAAMERARATLVEERVLRLTPHEVLQLEAALDADESPSAPLAALIRGVKAVKSAPVEV
jgi:uncharacterized protein (DUF1778 family)